MTRWESNMVAVAIGYLDAGQPLMSRDVLTALLRAQTPEEPKPVRVWVLDEMPQDASGGAEGVRIPVVLPGEHQQSPANAAGPLRSLEVPDAAMWEEPQ